MARKKTPEKPLQQSLERSEIFGPKLVDLLTQLEKCLHGLVNLNRLEHHQMQRFGRNLLLLAVTSAVAAVSGVILILLQLAQLLSA